MGSANLSLRTLPPVRYARTALGGTFDRLHIGHQRLISVAAALSDELLIGLTSDEFVRKTKAEGVQGLEERKKGVVQYLSSIGALNRSEIVVIQDAFGPASKDERLDAIVVTTDTVGNALKLNRVRRQGGLPPLEVVIVPMVLAETGGPVSSTRVRNGEIDAGGKPTMG